MDEEVDLYEPTTFPPYYGDRYGPFIHLTKRCPSLKRAYARGEVLETRGRLSDLDRTIQLCGWCRRFSGR